MQLYRGLAETSVDLCAAVPDGFVHVSMPMLSIFTDRRHYSAPNHLERLALGMLVQIETVMNQLNDMFPSEERKVELVQSMCENHALRSWLKQCLGDTCSTTYRAVRDIFFKLQGMVPC